MTRKKMEGDEAQRRKKAKAARERGVEPSAAGATSGASKQRRHKARDDGFLGKLRSIRRGKQPVIQQNTPQPNPGSGRPTGQDTPKKPAPKSARPSERKRRPR